MSLSAPDLPSGDVDASLSAPDLPSGDADASVSVPDMPSVDAKVPKKSLFGKFLKKKPSKGGLDVSGKGLVVVLWPLDVTKRLRRGNLFTVLI